MSAHDSAIRPSIAWLAAGLTLASLGCGAAAPATRCSEATATRAGHVDSVTADAEAPAATVLALVDAERRTAPPGTAEVAILARGDNAFIARLEMDAGAAVPEHRDETEEYIHVLEGGGTITIDGVAQPIGVGATVFMPANALVSFQNGDSRMVALQVFAGPGPSAKYDAWRPIAVGPSAGEASTDAAP